jgi:hypothetical protein
VHKFTLDPSSQKFYIGVVLRCNKAKRAPLQQESSEADRASASPKRTTKELTN